MQIVEQRRARLVLRPFSDGSYVPGIPVGSSETNPPVYRLNLNEKMESSAIRSSGYTYSNWCFAHNNKTQMQLKWTEEMNTIDLSNTNASLYRHRFEIQLFFFS